VENELEPAMYTKVVASTDREKDHAILGVVIKDIKTLMADFKYCLFKFSISSLNVVKHILACSAKPLVCNLSDGVSLEYIRVELCNDVS
jgi:hypothetical protein